MSAWDVNITGTICKDSAENFKKCIKMNKTSVLCLAEISTKVNMLTQLAAACPGQKLLGFKHQYFPTAPSSQSALLLLC